MDVLGAPKDFVKEAQGVLLVGRLGLCTTFARDARHVCLGEEGFSVCVFTGGKREQLLDEREVFYGLVGLECRIQT